MEYGNYYEDDLADRESNEFGGFEIIDIEMANPDEW
jgi:hypothetical protein